MIDLRRILVPTDFSDFSRKALVYAVAFADKFGASLQLLHVLQDLTVYLPEVLTLAPPVAPPIEVHTDRARQTLGRVVAEHDLARFAAQTFVVMGSPAAEIVRHAKEQQVDLIVMGTHGHTGLAHLLTGSVAEKVVRQAPCPVLTVHQEEREFVHP